MSVRDASAVAKACRFLKKAGREDLADDLTLEKRDWYDRQVALTDDRDVLRMIAKELAGLLNDAALCSRCYDHGLACRSDKCDCSCHKVADALTKAKAAGLLE